MLAYNASRAGLLVLCLGLGYVAGLRSALLIVAALLISGVLSWFLLRPQRVAMGLAVERSVARGQRRFAARAAAEDAYVDQLLAPPGDAPAQAAAPADQTERDAETQSPPPSRGDQPAS